MRNIKWDSKVFESVFNYDFHGLVTKNATGKRRKEVERRKSFEKSFFRSKISCFQNFLPPSLSLFLCAKSRDINSSFAYPLKN